MGIRAEMRIKWFPPSLQLVGLSLSKQHVLAWSVSGLVYSWGSNLNGVLGINENGKHLNQLVSSPALVDMDIGDNPGVFSGLATNNASFIINFRGRVYYWGK